MYSQPKTVLSASELFKYRLKKDSSLPVRGGQKDFEPDGSWMQAKTLETLIQEKTAIISEPRVEKLKHLVEGFWDEKKKLVNLKRPGKFWMHMGFTDNRRNWLYPEEALFLLETNNLEIFYNDIPLSIQEAYKLMLGSNLTVEEYQVFAHLRRLGYVVLRFEKEHVFTDYEYKIKMDQYSKKKKNKKKNKVKGSQDNNENPDRIIQDDGEEEESSDSEGDASKLSSNNGTEGRNPDTLSEGTSHNSNSKSETESSGQCKKRHFSGDELSVGENGSKKLCPSDRIDPSAESSASLSTNSKSDGDGRGFYSISSWLLCLEREKVDDPEETDADKQFVSELDQKANDLFPDIANKKILTLQCQDSDQFPFGTDTNGQIVFDVSEYRAKNPPAPMTKKERHEDNHEMRVKDLDFSFTDLTSKKQVQAKNWADFKTKWMEKGDDTSFPSALDHLWNDSITPLIKPEDATSYDKILEGLQIIQSANNETLLPDKSNPLLNELKISYDVHLPDNKFRKSMPGRPNHRICVTNSDDSPPSLAVIQHLWNECKDGVPIHWAVVDSGEITFFLFNNSPCLDSLQ